MYKIAIATAALAFLAAPGFTGTAEATPLATGAYAGIAATTHNAAPASTVAPVAYYNRYGHRSYRHYGGYGYRSFGRRGGYYGHRSYGYGGLFHGNRSFRGGRSYYRGGGFGGSHSFGFGRGGYHGGRGRY